MTTYIDAVGHLIEIVHAARRWDVDVDLDVRLAPEARDLAAVLGGGAAQHLHGDLVTERRVLGRVDDADAARADLLADAVLAAEHGAGELAGRGRRLRLAGREPRSSAAMRFFSNVREARSRCRRLERAPITPPSVAPIPAAIATVGHAAEVATEPAETSAPVPAEMYGPHGEVGGLPRHQVRTGGIALGET